MVENTTFIPSGEFPSGPVVVSEFSPEHWNMYRALKMKSVLDEPIAFGDKETELKKYAEREEKEWREILSGKLSGGREGESLHLFAQEGALIVGMLNAEITGKRASVQHLYVENDRRGKGTGRKLVLSIIERLREKGVEKVELSVVSTQEAAIKLYESLGFGRVNTVDVKRGNDYYPEFELELVL